METLLLFLQTNSTATNAFRKTQLLCAFSLLLMVFTSLCCLVFVPHRWVTSTVRVFVCRLFECHFLLFPPMSSLPSYLFICLLALSVVIAHTPSSSSRFPLVFFTYFILRSFIFMPYHCAEGHYICLHELPLLFVRSFTHIHKAYLPTGPNFPCFFFFFISSSFS